jgi:predicted DNA-binding protein (UPF0251 family)
MTEEKVVKREVVMIHPVPLTRREYFAAEALRLLEMDRIRAEARATKVHVSEMIAIAAVKVADAMIEELDK